MNDQDLIKVDIEEPRQEIRTIPLKEARETYNLTDSECNSILFGEVVWYRDVAISLSLREENAEPIQGPEPYE